MSISKEPAVTNESEEIPTLLEGLRSASPVQRENARQRLVAIGNAAVPSLIRHLGDRASHVRWEAAKALGKIADPISATALVNALEDKDSDVRWLAAVGLIALGRRGLPPLLAALIQRPDSEWLREGAHHVCYDLTMTRDAGLVRPVLEALAAPEPELTLPEAAYRALAAL